MKVIITSGYYNPVHIGHINLIREAKKLGDFLVVIVNNDSQVKIKGSVPFMTEQERVEIIKALKYVDEVFLSIDKDTGYQPETIAFLAEKYKGSEMIFAKGGDSTPENLPVVETEICKKFGIEIVFGVGGGKVQSSSWLIQNTYKHK
jgi:cytidyltransferase-like protein